MNRAQRYLVIPTAYTTAFGGLRWHPDAEAIEYTPACVPQTGASSEPDEAVGGTFAMTGEIELFLRGFATIDRPVCFGHMLHLLHLFGLSRPDLRLTRGTDASGRLDSRFQALGRPLRQAGALAAWLCRGLPRALETPEMEEILSALGRRASGHEQRLFVIGPGELLAENPPLSPAHFEARVLSMLDTLSEQELSHWLAFGREPIPDAGSHLASQVESETARSLSERLDALSDRPRLSDAFRLVPLLSGALSIPSRHREPGESPVGGLSDLSTRGRPESILPHQFALDPLEFLRRFAEHELLYFHREPPRARFDEEQVLLIDQGVRTWGDVRLILAASALALTRSALKKGTRLTLATTGTEGRTADPQTLGEEELGSLLESSDLSLSPASALERLLEERSDLPRDLVLLTHPLSLTDEDLSAAARRLAARDRLFAISVDDSGHVAFSELRHGTPIVLGRSRVDIPQTRSDTDTAQESDLSAEHWTGDIEAIGYPFRLGALQPVEDHLFDFDDSGRWLLLAEHQRGLLHIWSTDGTGSPWMLPRASSWDQVMRPIEAVIGVAGGFLVAGLINNTQAAAHYNLRQRTCTIHPLNIPAFASDNPSLSRLRWAYHRGHHLVLISPQGAPDFLAAIDLRAEPAHSVHDLSGDLRSGAPSHVRDAISACAGKLAPQVTQSGALLPEDFEGIRLDPVSGEIDDTSAPGGSHRFTFLSDGHPALSGGRLIRARRAGPCLALLTESRTGRRTLRLLRTPEFQPITSRQTEADLSGFALSRDGRRFARRVGRREIEVAEVVSPWSQFTTRQDHARPVVAISLGPGRLTLDSGTHVHALHWAGDALQIESSPALASGGVHQTSTSQPALLDMRRDTSRLALPRAVLYDRNRFTMGGTSYGLSALVDDIGQVALLDANGALVAMLLVSEDQIAGWMPDGTRFGPPERSGGPDTADAPERFAAQLVEAQSFGRRPVASLGSPSP